MSEYLSSVSRKRKRGARRRSSAPLVLVILFLLAGLVYAIVPRHHGSTRTSHDTVAVQASPQEVTSESPAPQASQTPVAQRAVSPQLSPSAPPPAPPAANEPHENAQLAIIIDDCGQWPGIESSLAALPIPLTLSIMPHVRYTSQIAQEAAGAGKGIMLHLPMEPLSHKHSGDGEIQTHMDDAAIVAQTEDDIARVPLATGVNNHEGSAASADPRVMKDVMEVVKKHSLFFIDSRTNAATVAASVAQDDGVPNASRDVFLDNEENQSYSERMLLHAAQIAKEKGSAIAIGHPKPTTLAAIRALYPQLQRDGIEFVLASSLVRS